MVSVRVGVVRVRVGVVRVRAGRVRVVRLPAGSLVRCRHRRHLVRLGEGEVRVRVRVG